jgi:hypothetical protein
MNPRAVVSPDSCTGESHGQIEDWIAVPDLHGLARRRPAAPLDCCPSPVVRPGFLPAGLATCVATCPGRRSPTLYRLAAHPDLARRNTAVAVVHQVWRLHDARYRQVVARHGLFLSPGWWLGWAGIQWLRLRPMIFPSPPFVALMVSAGPIRTGQPSQPSWTNRGWLAPTLLSPQAWRAASPIMTL